MSAPGLPTNSLISNYIGKSLLAGVIVGWLALLTTPAVQGVVSAAVAVPLGLLLVLAGAALGSRWEKMPGYAAFTRLAGEDPFSGRRWILSLGLYLALRLPLLLDGSFGADADCWRVAWTARTLWADGVYKVSRFPGYPVPEIALSPLIVHAGPVAAKLALAAVGFGALYVFDRLGRALGARSMGLVTLVLGTAPMFVVQTSNIMDYVPALAAMLAAMLMVVQGRSRAGGLWIGLGFACRITTAIYGLPMLMLARARGASTGRLAAMAGLGALSAAFWFAPVWVRYGGRFLTASDVPYDLEHASGAALGALGLWPLLALGLLFGDRLGGGRSEVAVADRAALAVAVGLGCVAFALFPLDAGYLLPPLVLALLLAAATVRPWALMALLLAGFVSLTTDEGRGSVAFERDMREKQLQTYRAVRAADVAGGVVALSGADLAVLAGLGADLEPVRERGPWRGALRDPVNDALYVMRLTEPMIRAAEDEERSMYLWGASLETRLSRGLGRSLVDLGAVVLAPGREARRRGRR